MLSGIGQEVQQRPAVVPSTVWQALERERAQIAAWLVQKPPLRLTRVHELLRAPRRDGGLDDACDGGQARVELGRQQREPTVRMASTCRSARRRRPTE